MAANQTTALEQILSTTNLDNQKSENQTIKKSIKTRNRKVDNPENQKSRKKESKQINVSETNKTEKSENQNIDYLKNKTFLLSDNASNAFKYLKWKNKINESELANSIFEKYFEENLGKDWRDKVS